MRMYFFKLRKEKWDQKYEINNILETEKFEKPALTFVLQAGCFGCISEAEHSLPGHSLSPHLLLRPAKKQLQTENVHYGD